MGQKEPGRPPSWWAGDGPPGPQTLGEALQVRVPRPEAPEAASEDGGPGGDRVVPLPSRSLGLRRVTQGLWAAGRGCLRSPHLGAHWTFPGQRETPVQPPPTLVTPW